MDSESKTTKKSLIQEGELKQNTKKEKEEKSKMIASEILDDGTIIEMLFDQKENCTLLAIYKNGKIRKQKSFSHNDILLKPHPANKDLFKNKVVLFPSDPKEYGSQKLLIDSIQKFIHKYLSVSDFFEKIASYYVLFKKI